MVGFADQETSRVWDNTHDYIEETLKIEKALSSLIKLVINDWHDATLLFDVIREVVVDIID